MTNKIELINRKVKTKFTEYYDSMSNKDRLLYKIATNKMFPPTSYDMFLDNLEKLHLEEAQRQLRSNVIDEKVIYNARKTLVNRLIGGGFEFSPYKENVFLENSSENKLKRYDKTQLAMIMYYGLKGHPEFSLDEVNKKLGLDETVGEVTSMIDEGVESVRNSNALPMRATNNLLFYFPDEQFKNTIKNYQYEKLKDEVEKTLLARIFEY